jgi:hypothetical protein
VVFEIDRTGWTKFFAGFALPFQKIDTLIGIYCIFQRDRLSILHINRLAFGQPAFIGIGNFFGTFFRTGVTGDTLVHIDVARMLGQGDLKIARCAGNTFYFGER